MTRLFNISLPTGVVLLVLSETLLLPACYLIGGIFGLNPLIDPWFYLIYDNGWLQVMLVVATEQLGLYMLDMYDLKPHPRNYLLQQMCLVLGLSFLLQALLGYSKSSELQLPQWTMLYGSGITLIAVPVWREIFFTLLRNRLPKQRLLFLGSSPLAAEVATKISKRAELGFLVEGYLDVPGSFPASIPHLGAVGDLTAVVKSHKNVCIVISQKERDGLPTQVLLNLLMQGVLLAEVSTLYEELFGRIALRTLDPYDLIFSKHLGPRPWTVLFQTLYSLVGALAGVVLTLPIMAVVAVAVKLTSPGPAFYSQERVGLNGRRFRILKFRSMHIYAEAHTGPIWATKDDPRVTPLGRWLRLLRLDELPQFFNVLQGHMALVGPRPERPEFCKILEEKIPFYHQRHSVKPGITGWAQINLKYAETVEDATAKLEYDLYYVKHLAPALDAYIIFHTLKVMLLSRGAQ